MKPRQKKLWTVAPAWMRAFVRTVLRRAQRTGEVSFGLGELIALYELHAPLLHDAPLPFAHFYDMITALIDERLSETRPSSV